MPLEQTALQTWRWYWALLAANVLDLAFTYAAVGRGVEEANRFLKPILLTPWPIAIKMSAFMLLGAGLLQLSRARQPLRLLHIVRATALFYLGVLLFHLLGLSLIAY